VTVIRVLTLSRLGGSFKSTLQKYAAQKLRASRVELLAIIQCDIVRIIDANKLRGESTNESDE